MRTDIQKLVINVPYGALAIMLDHEKVHQIVSLPSQSCDQVPSKINSDFAAEVADSLHKYFLDANKPLAFPLATQGTLFQRQVWQYLMTIPLGETRRYGEIAKALDTAPRAVANACRRNPTPVIVPCHRVVAGNGLGGYAGKIDGFEIGVKQWLLTHESN